MQCQTVLPGTDCTFWGKAGCVISEGSCQVIIDECEGCERIVDGSIGRVCSVYPTPNKKWQMGMCNFATHVKIEIKVDDTKVNPLKASKKASGGGKKK